MNYEILHLENILNNLLKEKNKNSEKPLLNLQIKELKNKIEELKLKEK